MSDLKTIFSKLTGIFSNNNIEKDSQKVSKKETLFDGVKSQNAQNENDIYNNMVVINQTKVKDGEKGSIEFLADLVNIDLSDTADIVYDKNGRVIKFNVNYELSDDYEKGRVRTSGHQYTIRYSADGNMRIRKTEVLIGDDGPVAGSPMTEVFEYDKDGNLTYSNVEY